MEGEREECSEGGTRAPTSQLASNGSMHSLSIREDLSQTM